VAAELRKRGTGHVEMKAGGLGEMRVSIDGRDVYVGSRVWYSKPRSVVAVVEKAIRG